MVGSPKHGWPLIMRRHCISAKPNIWWVIWALHLANATPMPNWWQARFGWLPSLEKSVTNTCDERQIWILLLQDVSAGQVQLVEICRYSQRVSCNHPRTFLCAWQSLAEHHRPPSVWNKCRKWNSWESRWKAMISGLHATTLLVINRN
jgi:hypothetical protein